MKYNTEDYLRKIVREQLENNIDEAYLYSSGIDAIFKKLNIDINSAKKLGEGDNGIAYQVGDKTIKITYDSEEAEFSAAIKGHKLERVANVYEVFEHDTESGEDNRNSQQLNRSRYYWVIIKEFIPHNQSGDHAYYNCLHYFDTYQTKNFDYSPAAFDRMISEYQNEHIAIMTSDGEEYDVEEDYELEDDLHWFNIFKELHMELQPLGILSVSDMKSSNMGARADGEPVYIELHIYKIGNGYKTPVIAKI